MVGDENSSLNEDIEAASGYSDSEDIGVFGFIQYYSDDIYNYWAVCIPEVLLQNKSVDIYTIKYNTAIISPITPVDSGGVLYKIRVPPLMPN
jgi:hypothetical protein